VRLIGAAGDGYIKDTPRVHARSGIDTMVCELARAERRLPPLKGPLARPFDEPYPAGRLS